MNPALGVPVVAAGLPRVRPPVNGEEAAVDAVPSEMPPGTAEVAVGAGLPNENPDPEMKEQNQNILSIVT